MFKWIHEHQQNCSHVVCRKPFGLYITSILLHACLGICWVGVANAQPWSTFLDASRAIDWTPVSSLSIPNYTTACSGSPPSLLAGSGNDTANSAAIVAAMNTCDATHNVVTLPSGTFYIAGLRYPFKGKIVLRGVSPNSTYLFLTAAASGCGSCSITMANQFPGDSASSSSLPPNGEEQCAWTGTNGTVGTYTQGATSIILNSCGGTSPGPPPLNQMIILDQAGDSGADNGGLFMCDTFNAVVPCTLKGNVNQNASGRVIGGVNYGQQQVVMVTAVSGSGSGPYTVTISPGLYSANARTSQTPGAWWNGYVQNLGLENLTIDFSTNTSSAYGITINNCDGCWMKNVRSMWGRRDHVLVQQSMHVIIRDSYFYQGQTHTSASYVSEPLSVSQILVENNVFQQVTNPIVFNQGSGVVMGYNYSVDNVTAGGSYMQAAYSGHNSGAIFNLFEGNNMNGIWSDQTWGSTLLSTFFRNMLTGWEGGGYTVQTYPVDFDSYNRGYNVIGNVLGQPSYHNLYESYATGASTSVGASQANTSIYTLGFTGEAAPGVCSGVNGLVCDAAVRATLMRWGNYDTVTAGVKWDSTEASPTAVSYIAGNFSSGYFGSLAHTLPASLYYNSKPSWWPSGKPWPLSGPDVSGGNLGICTGTFTGAQAITAGQCTGGTLNASYAGHSNSNPAQDCYLNTMGGPPDGTGSVLPFDAATCYGSSNSSGSLFRNSKLSGTAAK